MLSVLPVSTPSATPAPPTPPSPPPTTMTLLVLRNVVVVCTDSQSTPFKVRKCVDVSISTAGTLTLGSAQAESTSKKRRRGGHDAPLDVNLNGRFIALPAFIDCVFLPSELPGSSTTTLSSPTSEIVSDFALKALAQGTSTLAVPNQPNPPISASIHVHIHSQQIDSQLPIITVDNLPATLPTDFILASSPSSPSLLADLRILHHIHPDLSFQSLLASVTTNPAKLLGLPQRSLGNDSPATMQIFALPESLINTPASAIASHPDIFSVLKSLPLAVLHNGDALITPPAPHPLRRLPPLKLNFNSIESVIASFAKGNPVIILDSPNRENEGDIIFPAIDSTPEKMSLLLKYSSGVVCCPMSNSWADRLELPLMVPQAINRDGMGTRFCVTCDLINGTTTGISSHDRSATCHALADINTAPNHLARPGHIFPLRAVDGGVSERQGHTEAGVELCRLTNKPPVAVICEITMENGEMMRAPECVRLARDLGLAIGTIKDLKAHVEALSRKV